MGKQARNTCKVRIDPTPAPKDQLDKLVAFKYTRIYVHLSTADLVNVNNNPYHSFGPHAK